VAARPAPRPAQSLLESTDLPVERIAALSGLGTANNLRHHFLKQVGASPGDYRRAFPRQPRRNSVASRGRRAQTVPDDRPS
jgi:AraC family transcriptional regulator, transcriptional activator FtrA